MSSNDPYGTTPFNRNERLTAAKLESLRQGNQGNVQIRNPDNFVRRLPGGHILTEKRRRGSESASGIFILKITSSSSISAYVADIIDNRTDQTVLTEDVTLQALDHSDGTIPNDNMITCSYDKVNDIYEPVSYTYAYGT